MDYSLSTERYLDILTGNSQGPTMFAWRPDRAGSPAGMAVQSGSLDSVSGLLANKNAEGCGIFSLVNQSISATGRKKEDIVRVRAIWCDLDGADKLPDLAVEPSMVVETCNGWHIYYVLESPGYDMEWCVGMNRTLAHKYGGDSNACDVSRVLRLPGFYHCKGEPYMVTLAEDSGTRYSWQDLQDALGAPQLTQDAPLFAAKGETSQDTVYGLAAARSERGRMAVCPTGQGLRNRQLNQSAFKVGQLVGEGRLSWETGLQEVMDGARAMGYDVDHGEASTRACAISGMVAGRKSPRRAPEAVVAEEAPKAVAVVATAVDNRQDLLSRITTAIDRRIELGFTPAPSPLEGLNKRIGKGAPAGAVSLLGAPPGMGKSSLALDWAVGVAESGKPALFCSLELNELDLYARLTTLKHKVPWIQVRCGEHREKLLSTVQGSMQWPLYVITRNETTSVEMLRKAVDDLSQKYGSPPFVVIDYLQLLIPFGETREQWTVMADISGQVAHMAQDTGSPLLCITAINRQSYQLDKGGGKPDKYVALAAAKNSSRLEYDSELIMGLQLFDYNEETGKQYGWICIAKNRSGGSTYNVGVSYNGLSGKFTDADDQEVYAAAASEKERSASAGKEDIRELLVKALDVCRTRDRDVIVKKAGVPRVKGRNVLNEMIASGDVVTTINGELSNKERDDGIQERYGQ